MNPLDYFYYKLFKINKNGGFPFAFSHAIGSITMCFLLNIWCLFEMVLNIKMNYAIFILIVGIAIISMYIRYYPKSRLEQLEEKFNLLTYNQKLIGNTLIIAYLVLTFWFLFRMLLR